MNTFVFWRIKRFILNLFWQLKIKLLVRTQGISKIKSTFLWIWFCWIQMQSWDVWSWGIRIWSSDSSLTVYLLLLLLFPVILFLDSKLVYKSGCERTLCLNPFLLFIVESSVVLKNLGLISKYYHQANYFWIHYFYFVQFLLGMYHICVLTHFFHWNCFSKKFVNICNWQSSWVWDLIPIDFERVNVDFSI